MKVWGTAALLFAICSVCAAQERILWHDPGEIERVDFAHAAGPDDPPRPPFHFVAERLSESTPKVTVVDSAGVRWRVKGGLESRPESFATRLVGALGYHVAPTWFVARGRIEAVRADPRRAVHPTRRAILECVIRTAGAPCAAPSGVLVNARHQR